MNKIFVALVALSLAVSSVAAFDSRADVKPVIVVFETTAGKFEIAVDVKQAPITAANFLRYLDDGAYYGGFFHRTVRSDTETRTDFPIQVVQASPVKGTKDYPAIALERTNATGINHLAGTVSMARSTADSATSDFFVCITDSPELDFGGRRNADGQGFAAFGRVVAGMNVIKKIQASPTMPAEAGRNGQTLQPPIAILKAYRKKYHAYLLLKGEIEILSSMP